MRTKVQQSSVVSDKWKFFAKRKGTAPIEISVESGTIGDMPVNQDLGGGKNCVPAMKALSGAG